MYIFIGYGKWNTSVTPAMLAENVACDPVLLDACHFASSISVSAC